MLQKLGIAVFALMAVAFAAVPAQANYIYNLNFNGAGLSGSFQLTVSSTPNGLGGFDILNLTGTETNAIDGTQTVSLLGGSPGQVQLSPSGAFTYDNTLYQNFPIFDFNGLLFTENSVPGTEGNIFFNAGKYWFYLWSPTLGYYFVTPLQIPEPLSIALMGSGLLAAGWFRRRRKPQTPA